MTIHPTAIIDSTVKLGANVSVGAYAIISGNVEIGDNCVIHPHAAISAQPNSYTKIGNNCKIFSFAAVGFQPQDLKFNAEVSNLEIGDNNTIREHVTIHTGTEGGGGLTKIASNCLFMVGSHIAHDCVVGNNVILANNATLAGHVKVGDFAIVGGLSAVHQFVRIGHHAMIGGMSGIESDVMPFGSAFGERAHLEGLNLIGLKRRGFSRDEIHGLRAAYRMLFANEGTLEERLNDVTEQFGSKKEVMEIVDFIKGDTSRAICQPKK